MRIFGFEISRTKQTPPLPASLDGRNTWWPLVREGFPGAWQRNVTISRETVVAFHAVYACTTLIASDIAKLRIKLVEQDRNGIWSEVRSNSPFGPVLRKPNDYQTRIQFIETWVLSRLLSGNAYILKVRDNRGIVVRLYVLDPRRVQPFVSTDGSVFYNLNRDDLSGVEDQMMVPASEIIHDRMNPIFHPLVGVSPIFASGLAAMQGNAIQQNATLFFRNQSMPGGILTAPGHIDEQNAQRLKELWEQNYSGEKAGRVAVVGDGLKFEPLVIKAVDAQLIEQLKWTAEVVCSTFHVPPYKIGIGQQPTYNNVQALNVEYYSQCLQSIIESIENLLDEALGLDTSKEGRIYGTEFDLDGLLRMDSVAQMEMLDKGKSTLTPNEARRRIDLPPVEGGDSVYRQQQDYSLEALAKRDAQADPFAPSSSSAPPSDEEESDDAGDQQRAITDIIRSKARRIEYARSVA